MSRPVQMPPLPRESLTGYLQRHRQAGMAPIRLDVSGTFDNASAPTSVITQVRATTGLSPEQIRAMTMDRWVPSIRGYRVQRRHGWKLHPHQWWICPQCTVKTGYESLRWRLALQPICLHCRTYLVDPRNPQHPRPVSDATLEIVQSYDEILDAALSGRTSARRRLSGLRRACQSMAHAVAHGGQEGSTANAPQSGLSSWGPYPCGDPVTAAHLLTLTGTRLTRTAAAQRPASRGVGPARSGQVTSGATVTAMPRTRLRATVTRLAEWSQSTGLSPRHVPTIAQPRLYGPARRPSMVAQTGTALALHMLLDEATGAPVSAARARSAHGLTGEPLEYRLLHCVITRGGLEEDQQQRLLQAAEDLITGGLIDYQLRRTVFCSQPHLPRLPTPAQWIPAAEEFSAEAVTGAWAWMHVAGGHPQYGPVPSVGLDEIDEFDQALDLETRMHLQESVAAQIDGPDLVGTLTASSTRHPWAHQDTPRGHAG